MLIVGGYNGCIGNLTSAEIFEPNTLSAGAFAVAGNTPSNHGIYAQAVTLADGRALIVGGRILGPNNMVAAADLFDPATGMFSSTGGMNVPRSGFSATTLGNGSVLVAGGETAPACGAMTASAELYQPGTGSFIPIPGMSVARYFPAAVRLVDGRVLIVGGRNNDGPNISAELFDPVSNLFTPTAGSMTTPRHGCTATLLADWRVLVVGGYGGNQNSADIYDPASSTFAATGSMTGARYFHSAARLPGGKVLIAGGYNDTAGVLGSAEVYDPVAHTFSNIGPMSEPRYFPAIAELPSGGVLLAGGISHEFSWRLASTEVFDPSTITFAQACPLNIGRGSPVAAVLGDGSVLVAGGYNACAGNLTSAEFFDQSVVIAPLVISSLVGPANPLQLGSAAGMTVTFTGGNDQGGFTTNFTWDDGTTTTVGPSPSRTTTASRVYAIPGVYEVQVMVADAHGQTAATTFQYVVIYNPNGGYVTGDGWINSPAGAYAGNPTMAGRAKFGFSSEYKTGQTVPTGGTKFQFKAANFTFESTSYQWLVVAGAKAQFKGSGTLSGAGDFGFLLTATDGQVAGGGGSDKFRIKIVDKGTGAIIYDNARGASDDLDNANPMVIGGGTILIHKAK